MRYDYYDDDYYYERRNYYNPKRELAIIKNENLVHLGEKMKTSMCRVGQKKVKLFLNSLVKKGDSIAKMYRLILEAENNNINAKKYRNTLERNYKDDYYEKKREVIEELIKEVIEYNKSNSPKIVFGSQDSDAIETDLIIYFDLPDCEQISFHTDISSNLLSSVPEYKKEWDNQVNSTLPKIERAINKRYYDALYAKYKTEIDEVYEKERKKKERIERIRQENERKRQIELERVENLKSKIVDGVVWNDIKDLITSDKDAKIVKESIKKLSPDAYESFKESYTSSIDISLPDVRENNIDDLNEVLVKFNSMYNGNKKYILNLIEIPLKLILIDELTSAVAKYNSGAVSDTGDIKMYRSANNRYILQNIDGKHTIYFDSDSNVSELTRLCYKAVTNKEAKKIGKPKMMISNYISIIKNNKL